jgi:hypothetical protein
LALENCGQRSQASANHTIAIDLNRILRRGEIICLCMTALKAEGPPDTHELTSRVMTAKGLYRDDRVLAQAWRPPDSQHFPNDRYWREADIGPPGVNGRF